MPRARRPGPVPRAEGNSDVAGIEAFRFMVRANTLGTDDPVVKDASRTSPYPNVPSIEAV